MQEETYYSVRMRAFQDAPYEQGGERVITYSGLQEGVNGLLHKGFSHSRGTGTATKQKASQVRP
ncbi:6-carboxyhexanoate--CoA ligase [Bacillus halotolerans]|nr:MULTISPECIES: 6-carboxyhexanoate--CoA ligase [Bacillus]WOC58904.1 6-carboxyhexanoate--CoA ligase [Bacillus halotolerans]